MSRKRVVVSFSIAAATDLLDQVRAILNMEEMDEPERDRLREVRAELVRGIDSARARDKRMVKEDVR